jgi:exosortase/archaeosortase family protein
MEKLKQRFADALAKTKVYYQHILAISLILLLIFLVYWRDLEILANEALNSEALSHILLMPLFVGFLFYQKKELLKASLAPDKRQKQSKTKFADWLIGSSICIVAFLLYWYGSFTFYPVEYHLLSLPIFIIGITLILFNFRTLRAAIFPIIFLCFLIPLPSETMYMLGGNLANFNTLASYSMLKVRFGLPVILSTSYGAPTVLLTTSAGKPASFTIDLPCSGIYTFIAFVMFATFLTLIVSAPALKKIFVFIIGFVVFEILNIIRITIIISAAYFFGEEIAMLVFHTAAGLILTFIGMILTLFISERFLKIQFFSKKTDETSLCPKCKTSLKNFENFCLSCGRFFDPLKKKPSRTFWTKTIILLLCCSAITLSINAPVFAIAQGTIEVTSTWENTTNIFPSIPQYDLKFLYRDTNYEQIAKQDASLTYAYFNASNPAVYMLVGVANSISNLHNWEECLISWQTAQGQYPLVSVLDSRDIQLLENSTIIARYLVFKNPQNYTQVTLYWYEQATFKTGMTAQQKYVRISLVILTRNSTSYQQYETQLLGFGQAIAAYWEPMKNQSLISLGIPAQQTLLIISIFLIISTKTTQYTSEWRKRTNNLKIFNNFASPGDKLVLETITELNKKRKAITARDINLAIKSKVGKFMKFERLTDRLMRLQEYGFIKRDIIFSNNKPVLTWKSLVNI